MPARPTTAQMPSARTISRRPSASTWRSSGVAREPVEATSWPIRPSSVAGPVAVTRASPLPASTAVPRCTMFARSASGASGADGAAASFHTAALSPVRADSSTCRAALRSSRASAGTAAPASSTTTSPGTSSAAAIRVELPVAADDARGGPRARAAGPATRGRATRRGSRSRRSAASAAEDRDRLGPLAQRARRCAAPASSRSTTRLRNCARASRHSGVSRWSAIRLGPTARSRRCASAVSSPASSQRRAADVSLTGADPLQWRRRWRRTPRSSSARSSCGTGRTSACGRSAPRTRIG